MGLLSRSTPVEKAFAEHGKAVETLARWQAEESAKAAELADLEARVGSEVLDDETAAERLAEQVAKLRSQIDVASRTAAAASSRLVEAGRGVLRAHASTLKAQADSLYSQVEQRQAKTDVMLKALSEWEGGVSYIPWEPSSIEVVSAGGSVSYKVPMTKALKGQAAGLAKQAADFELRAQDKPETVAHWVGRLAGSVETSAPATVAG